MTTPKTPPVNNPKPTLLDLDLQSNTSPENPSETTLGLNNDPTKNPFWDLVLKAWHLRDRLNDPENFFWFIDEEAHSKNLSDDQIKRVMCSLKVALPGGGVMKPQFKNIKTLKMIDCKEPTKHSKN